MKLYDPEDYVESETEPLTGKYHSKRPYDPFYHKIECVIRTIAKFACTAIIIWILSVLYVGLSIVSCGYYCETGGVSARVDRLKRNFAYQVGFLDWFAQLSMKRNSLAQDYYSSVALDFEEAARTFTVHEYFSHATYEANMSLDECIHARITSFADLMETGHDGYKIEKDKCVMTQFMIDNKIPICDIEGMWYDKQSAKDYFRDENTKKFPVFLKSCHLTQGSARGTKFIRSSKDVQEVESWIDEKYAYRPDDFDRVWRKEGNALTDSITPGFLVQDTFPMKEAWEVNGRYSVGILEFRVEVYYGKSYLALLDGTTIFLPNGSIEDYTDIISSLINGRPGDGKEKQDWLKNASDMDCVWNLAERTAKIMQIDALRVDIFVDPNNPRDCKVNEISISSGMSYHGHEEFMAKVWKNPHLKNIVKFQESEKQIYELTQEDLTF